MLNTDFSKRIVINSHEMGWLDSPAQGVSRKPLAREAQESGHATSIVRYEKGAKFNRHPHPLGEEIFVLEGVFSDEAGDYPAGSYIRNPPGSRHAPFSVDGCTLFVKLHQFSQGDTAQCVIDTHTAAWVLGLGDLLVMPLHSFGNEQVALVKWPANAHFPKHQHYGGEEVLVLSGVFKDELGEYPAGTWTRSPHLSEHTPYTDQETVIWVKTGHLLAV
jgi:anti-sigma factor ChrR (cupin superfamily)